MTAETPAPQNLTAEESVLGALMLAGAGGPAASSASVTAVLATGLEPHDFYRGSHAFVFAAALAVDKRGEPTTVLAIERELRSRRKLTAAGGVARLQELAASVPAVANAGHYADLIVEAAARREQVGVALELKAEAENGAGVSADLLERIERLWRQRRPASERAGHVRVVTLDEFVSVEEPGAAAILGSAESALIPEGGDAMVYGDGGVGKTTLMIDLACHLAAGDDWLGIPVAAAVRVLVVENEGPRPLFRRKLARKRDGWAGSELGDRLLVFEQPWGRFSFAATEWRNLFAETIREREIDVVLAGPVTSSGMDAAGTLQEVREFAARVDEVRELGGRPIAIILVHHENKGGKVSGAWEGVGDTLLHVQQQGHGKLRLYVQKARWASEQHATSLQLIWAAGEGFELAAGEPPRPERVWEDIAAFVLEHGGSNWNTVDKAVAGEGEYKRRRRDEMLANGLLVNVGHGQAFELWHRCDPARPTLDTTTASEGRRGSDEAASATGDGAETATASPRRYVSTDAAGDAVGSTSPGDPKPDDVEAPAK
jgi:hypothetical protein